MLAINIPEGGLSRRAVLKRRAMVNHRSAAPDGLSAIVLMVPVKAPSRRASVYVRNLVARAGLADWRLPMPRYFFDIKDGHILIDHLGFDCESDTRAIDRAEVIAVGVSLDKPAVDPERRIAIRNDAGREIANVPVYSKPSIGHPAK
jgi:hypothetical protein